MKKINNSEIYSRLSARCTISSGVCNWAEHGK